MDKNQINKARDHFHNLLLEYANKELEAIFNLKKVKGICRCMGHIDAFGYDGESIEPARLVKLCDYLDEYDTGYFVRSGNPVRWEKKDDGTIERLTEW